MTSSGQRSQEKGHQPILSLASGGLAGLQDQPAGQEAKEAEAVPGLSWPPQAWRACWHGEART